ncbi:MAG: radical SAM protein [Desulfobacterales bacterium]|nr:radical SAM protein [Desulfobacterales bacterium]MBF0398219.1 radical SAM protein [Desulfobacterales bacterium]
MIYHVCSKEEYVFLHENKPKWLILNKTAREIALSLLNDKSIENIAKTLIKKYGISNEVAEKDIAYVLNELIQKDFISKDNSPLFQRIPALESVYFHLTNRCNLLCPQCYIAFGKDQIIDLNIDHVIKLIDELVEIGGKKITLSGGEPLLYPFIKNVIDYSSKHLEITMLTNGTLLDKEWAEYLSDKPLHIQISIDGSNSNIHDNIRGKGTFDKIVKSVGYLQNAGLSKHINFCTTIIKQNMDDLANIIKLAEKLEIPLTRFLPLRKIGRANEKWDEISGMNTEEYETLFNYMIEKQKYSKVKITYGSSGFLLHIPDDSLKDYIWCPVGKMITIDIHGNAYPCVLMMRDEFKLGNIFKDNLFQIINSDKMLNTCYALSNRRNKILKCAKCYWRNFCQSGCMSHALDYKGTVWDTDPFCNFRKNAYKNAFETISKIEDEKRSQ